MPEITAGAPLADAADFGGSLGERHVGDRLQEDRHTVALSDDHLLDVADLGAPHLDGADGDVDVAVTLVKPRRNLALDLVANRAGHAEHVEPQRHDLVAVEAHLQFGIAQSGRGLDVDEAGDRPRPAL